MSFETSQSLPSSGQALLGRLDTWQIREVPKEKWNLFAPIERLESIQAIFISGDAYGTTKYFEGVRAVAAMDVVIKEEPHKRIPGEPPTNIYHYAFEKKEGDGLIQWGPSATRPFLVTGR